MGFRNRKFLPVVILCLAISSAITLAGCRRSKSGSATVTEAAELKPVEVSTAKAEGREVALRLADWADVVVENFSPKAMAGWGLAYETLRARNPGLVMLSTCLSGGTGPQAGRGTAANSSTALAQGIGVAMPQVLTRLPNSDFYCIVDEELALVCYGSTCVGSFAL